MSELWDNLSRSERYGACDDESRSAGFGEAPQQAFLRPSRAAKIASVATLALLAVSALPLNGIISPTLDKNIPPYENRFILFVRVYRYTDIGKVVSQ